MTSEPHEPFEKGAARPPQEPPGAERPPPGAQGFGDEAATMPNEPTETGAARSPQDPTEVEVPLPEEAPAVGSGEADSEPDGESGHDLKVALEERTADLQRLQAEFLNYKRRVERDRVLIEQNATYRVLTPIIEVLDTIDRAREHGDLDEGFTTVAEQLERVVSGLGLTKFGAPGEPFDPNLHEALSHIGEDAEVDVTTCKVVAKAGYRIGDRVVRAAQVLVVDPAAG